MIWHIYIRQILYKNTCVLFLFSVKKTHVWIIASLTLKVTSWGYPIHGVYRPSLTLHYLNLFEESMTLWLRMSGKRNVSVCIGHELANALYMLFLKTHDWPKKADGRNKAAVQRKALIYSPSSDIFPSNYLQKQPYIHDWTRFNDVLTYTSRLGRLNSEAPFLNCARCLL